MLRAALPSANHVHNFETVAGLDGGGGPLGARENFEVALDGHAVGGQAEVSEQTGDAQSGRNFARVSIYNDANGFCHLITVAGTGPEGLGLRWNLNSP